MKPFNFTFQNLESQYRSALDGKYQVIRCIDFFSKSFQPDIPIIVNRVDVDFSVKKAKRIWEIFEKLGIKGTFFIRLHAPEYNPFSFENYKIIKEIQNSGHEIGYHSEVVDQSKIWNEDSAKCLRRDLAFFSTVFGVQVKGVASHGGMTGLNNLDFWEEKNPSDFGLTYEAYKGTDTHSLFKDSLYVSDSEWTRWKCYQNGQLLDGDNRSLSEHLTDSPDLVYLLVHPDTFFDDHFYE
jgi:hypothetical protein